MCDLAYDVDSAPGDVNGLTADKIDNQIKQLYAKSATFRALMDYLNTSGHTLKITYNNEGGGSRVRDLSKPITSPGDPGHPQFDPDYPQYNYKMVLDTKDFDGDLRKLDTNLDGEPDTDKAQTLESGLAHEFVHILQKVASAEGYYPPGTGGAEEWATDVADTIMYEYDKDYGNRVSYNNRISVKGSEGAIAYNDPSTSTQVIPDECSLPRDASDYAQLGRILLDIHKPQSPYEKFVTWVKIKLGEGAGKPSPLVLDLDGDGIELTNLQADIEDGVYFNMYGGDFLNATSWITGGDGLLVMDANKNGFIDDVTELFGDQSGYANGFLALATYDSNDDGQITAEDQAWSDLRVWVDDNQNGYSEEEELHTLDDLTITAISLEYTEVDYEIAGNSIYQEATFTMDGSSYGIVDAYFSVDKAYSHYMGSFDLYENILGLPVMSGFGDMPSLYVAISLDSDDQDPDSLASLVTDFSELTTEEVFADDTVAMDAVRDIMYRWAGVDDVSPTSRGEYVDAQELGFLEAMTGEPFLQGGYRTNPLWDAGADLSLAFEMAQNHYFSMLSVQTEAGELFTGDFYYDIASDSVEGITGIDLDILDDLETTATGLANTAEREVFWENVVRMVEYTVGTANLDTTSAAALSDAVVASDVSLTLNDILSALLGEAYSNEVEGTSGADTLSGTVGDDLLLGLNGDDTLSGGLGNDEIQSGMGADTLVGGLGDDLLTGGGDNDVYVYNLGEGLDVIYDDATSAADKIVFGAGIDAGDLTFVRAGDQDLEIHIDTGSQTGQVIITGQFHSYGRIETIEFADTSTLDLTAVNHTSVGTSGNDDLYGVTSGGGTEDVIYAGAGNDYVYAYAGDDVIYGEDGDDRLYGREDNDTLYGGNGNDTLDGYTGNDVLDTGAGDDTAIGASGDDTYYYTSGNDTYIENGGTDAIYLAAGYSAGSAIYYKINADLKVLLDTDDSITLKNFFNGSANEIEALHFDGGPSVDLTTVSYTLQGDEANNTLIGTSGADTFYGMGGNDTLDGGNGADYLYGGTGNDTLDGDDGDDYLDGGAGSDTLYGKDGNDTFVYVSGHDLFFETGSDTDTIQMAEGWTFEDISFRRYSTNDDDLVLELGGANSITLDNQFNTTSYQFENLTFTDLSSYTLTSLAYETYGTSGNDNISGITNGGLDTDTIYGLDGNDSINGGAGNDTLYGGAGHDTLKGGDGDDFLSGGEGDDYIEGADGNDTYFYEGGHDSYIESFSDTDVIQIAEGWALEDLTFRRYSTSDDDLVIEIDGSNSITLLSHFVTTSRAFESVAFSDLSTYTLTDKVFETYGTSGNDSIYGLTVNGSINDIMYGLDGSDFMDGGNGDDYLDGGIGNDSIEGGAGNDTLIGGTGDDIVEGEGGNDTFIYTSGLDTYYETSSGTDKLVMSGGVTINDISTAQVGNDAKIIVNSGVDEVTIYRQHYSSSYQIESIQFDDGFVTTLTDHLSWNWGTSGADTLTGTSGHDTIIGKDGNDDINGAAGADNIHGGSGNDTIRGGDSSDLLHGGLGDDILFGDAGADTVFGGGGADAFTFEAATAYSGIDIIKDFSTGDSDVIDISDVLDGIYDTMSDVLADFVQTSESGSDTLLSIDRDGTGTTYGWTQIASIQGVTGLGDADAMVTAGQLLAA